MIVVGWDPGTTNLGFGVLDLGPSHARCLDHGTCGVGKVDGIRDQLRAIATTIDRVCNTWCPDIMAYEDQAGVEVAMQRDGTGSNYLSRQLHVVTGMIEMAAISCLAEPIPCYVGQPRSIKVAVLGRGHGGAGKDQVQRWIDRMFGIKSTQHAADALGAGIYGARCHRLARAKARQTRLPISLQPVPKLPL